MDDVFEKSRVGGAGGGGAEVRDDGGEGLAEGGEESGEFGVEGFAVLGVVGAYADGFEGWVVG